MRRLVVSNATEKTIVPAPSAPPALSDDFDLESMPPFFLVDSGGVTFCVNSRRCGGSRSPASGTSTSPMSSSLASLPSLSRSLSWSVVAANSPSTPTKEMRSSHAGLRVFLTTLVSPLSSLPPASTRTFTYGSDVPAASAAIRSDARTRCTVSWPREERSSALSERPRAAAATAAFCSAAFFSAACALAALISAAFFSAASLSSLAFSTCALISALRRSRSACAGSVAAAIDDGVPPVLGGVPSVGSLAVAAAALASSGLSGLNSTRKEM